MAFLAILVIIIFVASKLIPELTSLLFQALVICLVVPFMLILMGIMLLGTFLIPKTKEPKDVK